MHPDKALITFEQEGSRVLAWINTTSFPPADDAAERDHRYGYLTAPLRQRGLECTVEYGLSDHIVNAELPDGSSLIISPPQEPSSDHAGAPESWMVTRHRSAEPAVYEVIYDSEPDGPHARHGGNVPNLLTAVDARLDRLGVPPRREHERSAEEHAAGTVLHRAGFVSAVALGGDHYHWLPSSMTDPAEQRLVVTRAFAMLQAEGFNLACDPALLDPSPLTDRHTAPTNKARAHADRTAPSTSVSPQVSAARAPSPSVGQRTTPLRLPAESSAPTVLPSARPSSAPGR
ncbi:hypothetical protein RCO28_16690 [Streptomyces sp. LHD-70]|uniref:hypothetical protein n=1 Tax=Streptomyces sp. LHD-70 TaxID=3072140 RepID=UPI00280FC1ED|nr:hypothetical protein [Streptomyces sp. LHD-70]MDQ8704113.1 hypothetical protein [Streptomyces sp. LHD-70]